MIYQISVNQYFDILLGVCEYEKGLCVALTDLQLPM